MNCAYLLQEKGSSGRLVFKVLWARNTIDWAIDSPAWQGFYLVGQHDGRVFIGCIGGRHLQGCRPAREKPDDPEVWDLGREYWLCLLIALQSTQGRWSKIKLGYQARIKPDAAAIDFKTMSGLRSSQDLLTPKQRKRSVEWLELNWKASSSPWTISLHVKRTEGFRHVYRIVTAPHL